jgi:hypothetical protein
MTISGIRPLTERNPEDADTEHGQEDDDAEDPQLGGGEGFSIPLRGFTEAAAEGAETVFGPVDVKVGREKIHVVGHRPLAGR